jgi:hypothetical protein
MDMTVPALVRFPYFLGIYLMKPVIFGEDFPYVVVKAIDALVCVGVFFDMPVPTPQVI